MKLVDHILVYCVSVLATAEDDIAFPGEDIFNNCFCKWKVSHTFAILLLYFELYFLESFPCLTSFVINFVFLFLVGPMSNGSFLSLVFCSPFFSEGEDINMGEEYEDG